MTISLLIDTSGGSNFETYHLRNLGSLHIGGAALSTETLDVTGTVGISSTLKVDTISETTSAAGVTIDGVVIKDSGATFSSDVVMSDQATIGGSIEIGSIFNIEPGVAARDLLTSVGTGLHIEADTQAINAAGNSETVAIGSLAFVGIPTWTSVGSSFTVTAGASVYIQGVPVGSTNVTITSAYALWVDAGEVRLDGAVTIGGVLSVDDATDSTSGTTGSIHTDGGLGVVKDIAAGNDILLTSSGSVINWLSGDVTLTHATGKLTFGGDGAVEIDFNNHEMTNVDIDSGAIDGTTIGAASAAAATFTSLTFSGVLSVDDTTDTTSGTTGSIHTDGGLGVAKALWVATTSNLIGNVAIGPSTADVLLHLSGADTAILRFENTDTTLVDAQLVGKIEFEKLDSSGAGAGVVASIRSESIDSAGSGLNVIIATGDGNGNNVDRLTVEGDGVAYFSKGKVFLADTANGKMTLGLTINQGTNDDEILTLKSSDVAHGLTTSGAGVETDTFFTIKKTNGPAGGVRFFSIMENTAEPVCMQFASFGGQGSTTKTTGARGLVEFFISQHDGSNALANITANGNILAVRAQIGGTDLTRFLLDEDGDIFCVTAVDVASSGNAVAATAFDSYDDAQLVRALDVARTPEQLIISDWDEKVRYNEQSLIDAGVLGGRLADGGMTNITQLQRLHNGAIWQAYTERQEIKSEVEVLQERLADVQGRLEYTEKQLALLN
jgi:carbonic anhydrase/acetyltransferase-like protein (isoleucine patch superfamily)